MLLTLRLGKKRNCVNFQFNPKWAYHSSWINWCKAERIFVQEQTATTSSCSPAASSPQMLSPDSSKPKRSSLIHILRSGQRKGSLRTGGQLSINLKKILSRIQISLKRTSLRIFQTLLTHSKARMLSTFKPPTLLRDQCLQLPASKVKAQTKKKSARCLSLPRSPWGQKNGWVPTRTSPTAAATSFAIWSRMLVQTLSDLCSLPMAWVWTQMCFRKLRPCLT